jgi:hypothetical protein
MRGRRSPVRINRHSARAIWVMPSISGPKKNRGSIATRVVTADEPRAGATDLTRSVLLPFTERRVWVRIIPVSITRPIPAANPARMERSRETLQAASTPAVTSKHTGTEKERSNVSRKLNIFGLVMNKKSTTAAIPAAMEKRRW